MASFVRPRKGRLQQAKGKKVLINGASGGVGSFALQFAKWAGAEVATTCSAANIDYVKSLGANEAIDYKNEVISQRITQWAPAGIDLIIDAVGGNSLADPVALLKKGGRLINIATITDDGDIQTSITDAQRRGVTQVLAFMDNSSFKEDLQSIIGLYQQGKLRLPPTEKFGFEQIGLAHKKLEQGHVSGKLLLEI